MLDYMQYKPIILQSKVHWRFCAAENKTLIFHKLSPIPFTHMVWADHDQMWVDFKCNKN